MTKLEARNSSWVFTHQLELVFSTAFLFKDFIYLFEVRERMSGEERGRGRGEAVSPLNMTPNAGLDPRTPRLWLEPKADPTDWATQVLPFYSILNLYSTYKYLLVFDIFSCISPPNLYSFSCIPLLNFYSRYFPPPPTNSFMVNCSHNQK